MGYLPSRVHKDDGMSCFEDELIGIGSRGREPMEHYHTCESESVPVFCFAN